MTDECVWEFENNAFWDTHYSLTCPIDAVI